VAYQSVPTIGYFEWFYDPFRPETYSRPHEDNPLPNVMRMPLRNASQLLELEYCTKGYSPTCFQRRTYPETYQHKLSTRFDGINTELYQPGIPSSGSQLERTWPTEAKLVTFVSRGLEAFRGFDIFMEVAHKLSLQREDVHFAIAGKPQTNYGNEVNFKDDVMERLPYDLNRFHFFEWLPEPALADLFRISDCHFYWTIPFTLSWSFFQAMASGCLVLASDSEPVRDTLVHEQNGLLAQPYDIDEMVDKLCEALDDPGQFQPLRDAARETIVNDYSFQVCLPRLAEFYLSETV
jgi:glycosyltransferase involved in cell wall biosynthesis